MSPAIEEQVVWTIADWAPSTEVTRDERSHLLGMVKAKSLTPAWAELLIEIGGREETKLVLQHGGVHDESLLWAIHHSSLTWSRWPGILPYLKEWLEDPVVAQTGIRVFDVFEYRILGFTARGRHILLDYATDAQHPVQSRQRAVEELEQSLAGVQLLLDAAKDPVQLSVLGECVVGDPIVAFRASQSTLHNRNGADLWTELIDGLSLSYWLPENYPPQVEEQLRAYGQQSVKASLQCLQELTGRADLKTESDWRAWYSQKNPNEVPQCQLVQLVIDHPKLLAAPALLRRMVPWHLGKIPADCMPLYKELLRNGPPASKYWACSALLYLTDDLEAVPVAIELIGNSTPSDVASVHPAEIGLLQRRFAVNFYWDTSAWRKWWKTYEPQASRELLHEE